MNNDLISRQAAINKILGQPPEPHYPSWYAEQIKELPSAQPTFDARDTQYNLPIGTDCISRQTAIDYFVTNVGFHDEDGYPIEDECELREIWTGYFDGIPFAQPEPLKIDLSGYSEEDWERLKKEWENTPITVLSAQPKRGKWLPADSLYHGAPFYCCSECGEVTLDTVMCKPRARFCPMCGAKMEVTT